MKLIIHRGTQEIGGSCVELVTVNSRILIDFGMPLVDNKGERFDSNTLKDKTVQELKESGILPDIKGLYRGEEKAIDAILISHSHMDHYGFLTYVHEDIPIYMSQGAQELINITNIFVWCSNVNIGASIIENRKPFLSKILR